MYNSFNIFNKLTKLQRAELA